MNPPARVATTLLTLLATTLLLAACGGGDDSDSDTSDPGSGVASNIGARTANIQPCTLLTDEDLMAILGLVPTPQESEPAGPFTGCSWDTGLIRVSIATSDRVILAPGEEDCPSADLGDESYLCEGRLKLLTNGIHLTVSSSDRRVTATHLRAAAEAVLPRLQP